MSHLRNPIVRLLDRAARRLRRARPGSVLIMVVSLLALLALMGTAWIAATREDRIASQQHIANTQLDLLVEAVTNMVEGTIMADLVGNNNAYRPRYDTSDGSL